MAKTADQTATEDGATPSFPPTRAEPTRLREMDQKSILAFAYLHSRLMRTALGLSAKVLDLAHRRVQEKMRIGQDFAGCKTVADAAEVVNGVYRRAFDDYAEEARRALQRGADLMDFAHRRVHEKMRTSQELARCKTVADAAEIMSGFYQNALDEYSDQASKVIMLRAEITRRTPKESSAAEDRPLKRGTRRQREILRRAP